MSAWVYRCRKKQRGYRPCTRLYQACRVKERPANTRLTGMLLHSLFFQDGVRGGRGRGGEEKSVSKFRILSILSPDWFGKLYKSSLLLLKWRCSLSIDFNSLEIILKPATLKAPKIFSSSFSVAAQLACWIWYQVQICNSQMKAIQGASYFHWAFLEKEGASNADTRSLL